MSWTVLLCGYRDLQDALHTIWITLMKASGTFYELLTHTIVMSCFIIQNDRIPLHCSVQHYPIILNDLTLLSSIFRYHSFCTTIGAVILNKQCFIYAVYSLHLCERFTHWMLFVVILLYLSVFLLIYLPNTTGPHWVSSPYCLTFTASASGQAEIKAGKCSKYGDQ